MGAAVNLLRGADPDTKFTILSYPEKFHDIIFEEGRGLKQPTRLGPILRERFGGVHVFARSS